MSDKQEKVIDIIVDKLGVEKNKVTPEANFINDLGADSLDQVELIMELEEEFDLEISDEEAESLTTVSEVLKFLDSK
tara:strand:+ start:696 stop:926 length:231 start_codon:yes stop_codon:yes gene_type:complete